MRKPCLSEERKLWRKGYKRVACLDEAGVGPLAGPVVAAAVVLSSKFEVRGSRSEVRSSKPQFKTKKLLNEVRDSKKLSPKKREELYKIITRNPLIEWSVGRVSEKVIDRINILEAAKLAMLKALEKLKTKPDFIIVDGKAGLKSKIQNPKSKMTPIVQTFGLTTGQAIKNSKIFRFSRVKSIIKADEKVFSCAAASIIAKVHRDRIMRKYDQKYPQYGFAQHKGYPTKQHKEMLKKYGPSLIHRKSFAPVRECDKIK